MTAPQTYEEFERQFGSQLLVASVVKNNELDFSLLKRELQKLGIDKILRAFRNEILDHQSKHGPQTGKKLRVENTDMDYVVLAQNNNFNFEAHPSLKSDGIAKPNEADDAAFDRFVDKVANDLIDPKSKNKDALTLAYKAALKAKPSFKPAAPKPGFTPRPQMVIVNRPKPRPY